MALLTTPLCLRCSQTSVSSQIR